MFFFFFFNSIGEYRSKCVLIVRFALEIKFYFIFSSFIAECKRCLKISHLFLNIFIVFDDIYYIFLFNEEIKSFRNFLFKSHSFEISRQSTYFSIAQENLMLNVLRLLGQHLINSFLFLFIVEYQQRIIVNIQGVPFILQYISRYLYYFEAYKNVYQFQDETGFFEWRELFFFFRDHSSRYRGHQYFVVF